MSESTPAPTKRKWKIVRRKQDASATGAVAHGKSSGMAARAPAVGIGAVTQELEAHPALQAAMKPLPANYNFEVPRTIARLRALAVSHVALQLPEGLLLYAPLLADIIAAWAHVDQVSILGDVTYGACCVDDYGAQALGAQALVHYGHSCLVPVTTTRMPCLYVFVDISFDIRHVVAAVRHNWPANTKLALAGTIQFASAMDRIRAELGTEYPHLVVPQVKPLSRGETLGCTSPKLPAGTEVLLFIADGRFHMESTLIANPGIPAFRYNPYDKALTSESYDIPRLLSTRQHAVQTAARADTWGLILGTLGRQGNPAIYRRVKAAAKRAGKQVMCTLMSEIFPGKLALMPQVGAWVQVACPRLSMDWGDAFAVPLLNPYEALAALGEVAWRDVYPMDFYAAGSGPWTNYHQEDAGSADAASAAVMQGNVTGSCCEDGACGCSGEVMVHA